MLDMLIYLAPSLALAGVVRFLARRHPFFFLLTLAGTFCHELAHFCVGLITGARPASLSIFPQRKGNHWQLGAVVLGNIRWYNAAPTALAPLLIIAIPFLFAAWRVHGHWAFTISDIFIAFLLAPQFLSFWPSSADWHIAWRSWPYLIVVSIGYGLYSMFAM